MNPKNDQKIVYLVHCVDTEGPLHEPVSATFDRMQSIFGINLEPSDENLGKIQKKEIDLGGLEDKVAETFSPHMLDYKDTWEKLDQMLLKIMSADFRKKVPDSFGGGWVFNWHCLDHVGYNENPRRRDIGFHRIFDHYSEMIQKTSSCKDGLHWHFHPMAVNKEAHRCATSYLNSPHLYEILCRRVIERKWFPQVSRPGFHAERPDSHWFLEQWIPFDIANISAENDGMRDKQLDLHTARFGDWRLAPKDWTIYHPSHDNYQLEGNCRRWIARVLNLQTRVASITQEEVDKAFERANKGLPTLLCVTNHDFRDMESEISSFQTMIQKSAGKCPKVSFRYSEAVEAFRNVIYGDGQDFGKLVLDLNLQEREDSMILKVRTKEGQVFGPQPFLAIKTKSGQYIHDNFDFDTSLKGWSYTFDQENILPKDISAIGVASNDKYANTFVEVIDL